MFVTTSPWRSPCILGSASPLLPEGARQRHRTKKLSAHTLVHPVHPFTLPPFLQGLSVNLPLCRPAFGPLLQGLSEMTEAEMSRVRTTIVLKTQSALISKYANKSDEDMVNAGLRLLDSACRLSILCPCFSSPLMLGCSTNAST